MSTLRLAHFATALIAALPALAVLAQEPGETWEVTTEMQVAGMSMPARTQQVCTPRDAPEDVPQGVPTQESCEMYDVRRTGASMSWKLRCAGDPPTSGSGEMHYPDKDNYSGQMQMKVGADEMQMKMRGKRLGTACDAGQVKRQIAAAQAQSARHIEETCRQGVETMAAYLFSGSGTAGIECPASYKEQYCARLSTEAGFDKVAGYGASGQTGGPYEMGPGAAAEVCGLPSAGAGSFEGIRADLCRTALAGESLVFLGRNCVAEGRDLAMRECAGRSYSSPVADKYRDFCTAYARHGALPAGDTGTAAARAPEAPKDSAIKAGKKALRGLIGF